MKAAAGITAWADAMQQHVVAGSLQLHGCRAATGHMHHSELGHVLLLLHHHCLPVLAIGFLSWP